jgi:Lipopolysaccharide kinase (Kdo/WaaP) family
VKISNKESASSFSYKRSFYCEILYANAYHNERMLTFFSEVECHLQCARTYFKNTQGDTTTVGLVEFDKQKFIIKRYNFRNFWHGCKLQFRKSHGFRSFYYAFLLNNCGIPAIKPVAVIQRRNGIFKKQSYFISHYEEGVRGCDYFNDESDYKQGWPETISAIVTMTQKMRENQIYHGDFHFGNLVIVDKNPILLDFDRVKKINSKKRFAKLHVKDLNNFYRYLQRNLFAYQQFYAFPLSHCVSEGNFE